MLGRSSCILALALWSLLTIQQLWADDIPTANRLLQEGIAHLQAADHDSTRLVDGAVALAQALAIYERFERWDQAVTVRSSLFWARKRMNRDQIHEWLARRPVEERAGAEAALATAEELSEERMDPAEADRFFGMAEEFATNNPNDYFLIAIRYFEVAERFAGSEVAINAQRRSLDAQQAHMREFTRSAAAERERALKEQEQRLRQQQEEEKRGNIFSRPAAAGGGNLAVPDTANQRRAQREFRQVYADRLRERDPAQRWVFAGELLEQAKATDHDPALRYTMLSEALDLAVSSSALHLMWDLSQQLAEDFAGLSQAELLSQQLSRVRASPSARAMQSLLSNPLDPDANSLVGQFFVLEADRLESGIDFLLMGSNEQWRSIGGMERAGPREAQERYQLARAWDGLIADERDARRNGTMRRRALHWYELAEPGLNGMAKTIAAQRIAELRPTVPLLTADWNKLNALDWERLVGTVVTVDATRGTKLPLSLGDGQKMRIVPHPDDRWNYVGFSSREQVDHRGTSTRFSGESFRRGAMLANIDGTDQAIGVIEGPAREITLKMHTSGRYRYSRGEGTMRVKLVPVR
ncbi:MAG: hypothetical protein EA402_14710 [Planctomycetota bacterium]|nr:MAG: hypothetical protein EA402_14710 [Planctomycetota bacterium]